MPAIATPLFAGDLYDTALRLTQSHINRGAAGSGSAMWRQMLELGWQGVLIAEEHGGVGAHLADFAAIVEAVARQALPVPLIERCAVAPALLTAAASHPAARALLEECTEGKASVCPVLHAREAAPPTLDDDGRLGGTVAGADVSEPATHFLFEARRATHGEPVLVLLPADAVGDRLKRYQGGDGRITADLDVAGLPVGDAGLLLSGASVPAALEVARQLGSLLSCVRTVGSAGAMIEQTIDYLNTRVQFGAALSSFQALRHRVVEMYVSYENARGLVREQVLQHAAAPDARQLALTRLYAQDIGRDLAESAIQLHGGMGMSQETLAARLATHTLMTALQFGDKSQCLDWLATGLVAETQAAAA